jgi:hypothetical protein
MHKSFAYNYLEIDGLTVGTHRPSHLGMLASASIYGKTLRKGEKLLPGRPNFRMEGVSRPEERETPKRVLISCISLETIGNSSRTIENHSKKHYISS